MKLNFIAFLFTFGLYNQILAQDAKTNLATKPVNSETKIQTKASKANDSEVKLNTSTENKSSTNSETTTSLQEYNFETSLNRIEYPELQVVPRASERLLNEARFEKELKYLYQWTYFASGSTTLLASLMVSSNYNPDYNDDSESILLKEKKNAVMFSQAVGLSWIALAYYLSEQSFYNNGYQLMRKIRGNGNDKRSDLLQERISEEILENAYDINNKLTTISVTTNSLAGLWLLTHADSVSRPYAAISFFSSFLPLLFPVRYIEVFEKQQEYKKKIYSPLVYLDYKPNLVTSQLSPYLNFTWKY